MRIVMAFALVVLAALPAQAFTLEQYRGPGFTVGFPETWTLPVPLKGRFVRGLEARSPDALMRVEVFRPGDRPMAAGATLDVYAKDMAKRTLRFYQHTRPRRFMVAGRQAEVRVYTCQLQGGNWRKYLYGVVEDSRGGVMAYGSVADSVVPAESAYSEGRFERFLAIVRSLRSTI